MDLLYFFSIRLHYKSFYIKKKKRNLSNLSSFLYFPVVSLSQLKHRNWNTTARRGISEINWYPGWHGSFLRENETMKLICSYRAQIGTRSTWNSNDFVKTRILVRGYTVNSLGSISFSFQKTFSNAPNFSHFLRLHSMSRVNPFSPTDISRCGWYTSNYVSILIGVMPSMLNFYCYLNCFLIREIENTLVIFNYLTST